MFTAHSVNMCWMFVAVMLPAQPPLDEGNQLVCAAALVLLVPPAAKHSLNQLCKLAVQALLGAPLQYI